MRLNVQSDYALRLLMHLAVNEEKLCTIARVAQRYGISRNHLMKVAHVLGREGFLHTVRGRSGGLRLARPAGRITVGEVMRRTEADFALVECFQTGGQCLITPACKLQGVLAEAMDAFLEILDRYTLADLTGRNAALHALLDVRLA